MVEKKKKKKGSSPHFSARVAWGSTVFFFLRSPRDTLYTLSSDLFVTSACDVRAVRCIRYLSRKTVKKIFSEIKKLLRM